MCEGKDTGCPCNLNKHSMTVPLDFQKVYPVPTTIWIDGKGYDRTIVISLIDEIKCLNTHIWADKIMLQHILDNDTTLCPQTRMFIRRMIDG